MRVARFSDAARPGSSIRVERERSHLAACSRTLSLNLLSRSPHSQTMSTRQPAARRRAKSRSSLATFSRNFSRQNRVRDLGVYANLQPGCLCQKHPCTIITARHRGSTKSGLVSAIRL